MRLEHRDIKKFKKEILAIVGKHLDLQDYQVFFFGSRVQGKGGERSDIDIGIQGRGPIPTKIFSKIREEIDAIPTLYTIDVVDFHRVSTEFRNVALRKTESFQ